MQILNEPTAAALTYEQDGEETELVLVYDLGGGTFDVSIVEITGAVTEVLASHGNNNLGGDDFDRRIQRYFREQFQAVHEVELSDDPSIAARLLRAAESAKIALSDETVTAVREPFLASVGNKALHLELEFTRDRERRINCSDAKRNYRSDRSRTRGCKINSKRFNLFKRAKCNLQ